jgi:predicted nucleic acid-binding Zn ribbon protein
VDEVVKVLPSVLKRQVQRVDPRLVEILAPLWSHVAGPAIAQQSQPDTFAAGTLTLAAADSGWAKALTAMREELRDKINAYLGRPVVRALRIRKVHKLTLPLPSKVADPKLPDAVGPAPVAWTGAEDKLEPEMARIARLSYAKYFARNRKGAA